MTHRHFSNVIGFDDAPFAHDYQGRVKIVGAVFAKLRFDGVVIGEIEKDGTDAAAEISRLVAGSRFAEHVKLIILQGITLGGFNVVDVFSLSDQLTLPVMVVSRNIPDMSAIRKSLLSCIADGEKKWSIIDKLGSMEPVGDIYVQRVGLTHEQAVSVIKLFSVHSQIPEPVRAAHLIAGAIGTGQSRGAP